MGKENSIMYSMRNKVNLKSVMYNIRPTPAYGWEFDQNKLLEK